MPSSVELVLGVKGLKNVKKEAAKVIKFATVGSAPYTGVLKGEREGELNEALEEIFDKANSSLSSDLVEAHRKACEEAGFTYHSKDADDHLYLYKTPKGNREMIPFSVEFFFDPDEIGDTEDTMVFGVSLSGRYFPTFLDWQDPHGTLTEFVMDDKGLEMMQIAKRQIAKVLPTAAEWAFIIQERFY